MPISKLLKVPLIIHLLWECYFVSHLFAISPTPVNITHMMVDMLPPKFPLVQPGACRQLQSADRHKSFLWHHPKAEICTGGKLQNVCSWATWNAKDTVLHCILLYCTETSRAETHALIGGCCVPYAPSSDYIVFYWFARSFWRTHSWRIIRLCSKVRNKCYILWIRMWVLVRWLFGCSKRFLKAWFRAVWFFYGMFIYYIETVVASKLAIEINWNSCLTVRL